MTYVRSARPLLVLMLGVVACDGPAVGPTGPGGVDGPGTDETGFAPRLAVARAQGAGLFGEDLHLAVEGLDEDADVVGVLVAFKDASGAPVACVDADVDGVLDVAPASFPFDDGVPDAAAFAATTTMTSWLSRFPAIATLEVAALDGRGNVSPALTVEVRPQPVRSQGEACDPSYVLDRCGPGLGCKGEPATCQEGEAPLLERAAFVEAQGALDGPRVLARVTDPDGDLVGLHVELLDADLAPVSLDFDGDGVDDGAEFDFRPELRPTATSTVLEMIMGTGVELVLHAVRVTAVDASGRTSESVTATLAPPQQKNPGALCDAAGFEVCSSGYVCAPSANGLAACQNLTVLRGGACAAAPVVDVGPGTTFLDGETSGASLWDAPGGCATQDPVGRPDQVVWLNLVEDAYDVVVSTDHAATSFDTVLYVLDECTSLSPTIEVCNDDAPGTVKSAVALGPTAKGPLAIVVDSFAPAGGAFRLEITVE